MSNQKVFLNRKTKTLHIVGGCRFSNEISTEWEYYENEEMAQAAVGKKFIKRCKLCFKDSAK